MVQFHGQAESVLSSVIILSLLALLKNYCTNMEAISMNIVVTIAFWSSVVADFTVTWCASHL